MTALASMRNVAAQWRSRSRHAPITWGWQRKEYGSCTRVQSRCEARIPLPRGESAILAGDRDLSGLAADLVDALVERRVAGLQRVDRHGARDDGGREHVFRAEQAREGERGRHLRAVDEREALFGAERARREPRAGEAFGGRQYLAADAHLADTEQHRTQVGERGKIAGCADGALRRNHGVDLVRQQRAQGIDERQRDTGIAAGESVDFEREDQSHYGIR